MSRKFKTRMWIGHVGPDGVVKQECRIVTIDPTLRPAKTLKKVATGAKSRKTRTAA
ncbi:MAG: hypothetical protein IT462_05250 [Planctomycetes bacterium]|nr:hypothetical protein [Planctomycetota bacterium]